MLYAVIPEGRRLRASPLSVLATLATVWAAATTLFALASPVHAAAQGTRDLLYVAAQEDVTVAIIDMATNELIETVDLKELGFSATAKAHHTAVEPDGSFWYVSLIAAGKVLKFDRENRLVGQADFETPGMLSLDPTADRLYVGRSMAAVNPPAPGRAQLDEHRGGRCLLPAPTRVDRRPAWRTLLRREPRTKQHRIRSARH
jgi:hypothetical protein